MKFFLKNWPDSVVMLVISLSIIGATVIKSAS
jgi:hypothetical protein